MCGIIGMFDIQQGIQQRWQQQGAEMAAHIRHRGPDARGSFSDDFCVLHHERLAIIDPETGAQPLFDKQAGRVLVANAEIYDYQYLKTLLQKPHDWQTGSDCEVLLYLYEEFGPEFLQKVDGMFAFCIYDQKTKAYFIARDHMGIIPLYIGWDDDGVTYIASEMKAIQDYCTKLQEFPPGHYYRDGEFTQWYTPSWAVAGRKSTSDVKDLQKKFETAVTKQLVCDVPYGVLISGGLDSSLVAAIAAKYSGQQLKSFSIGLEGSPDLAHAREVADFVGTEHHEIKFTVPQGIAALHDVIWHLETYDVTTIRASTPMYLLAQMISELGVKMVFSGEGADEIFGGYLYFHMAPSAQELHAETVRKLMKLSKYDCLRANKSMAAFGVEIRVPFLGKDFLDYAMSLDPQEKMCGSGKPEKYVLRDAFDGYIPEKILWRQKEQFSDGVGYGWIDGLKAYAQQVITDRMLKDAPLRFAVQPPETKEAYLYREIFDELFPGKDAALTVEVGPSIACSSPTAYRWSKSFASMADPSGRAVSVHQQAVPVVEEAIIGA